MENISLEAPIHVPSLKALESLGVTLLNVMQPHSSQCDKCPN